MHSFLHGLGVGTAYVILIFFCLGTIHDFAKFMAKGFNPSDRTARRLIQALSTLMVLMFAWALWMVSPAGCS